MGACFVASTEHLERLAQAEVAVRGRWVDIDQLAKSLFGKIVPTAVVVGTSKRLDDRALVRLQPIGAFEQHRGLSVMTALEQHACSLEEPVRRFPLRELVEARLILGIHAAHR